MTNGLDFDLLLTPRVPTEIGIRLSEFGRFERGWHFGEGETFAKVVLSNCLAMSSEAECMGFSSQEVFPGLNGDILLCIYPNEDEEIEITFGMDGMVEILREARGECRDDIRGISLEEASGWLENRRIANRELSGSSTFTRTIVRKRGGSAAMPCLHPAATMASPSLTRTAPAGQAGQFVAI